ncbi:MAG: HypC/HybG/HupF family hydrogenase formation chaperone [Thermoleophilaceae bacterium]|nr:HypC/HybG/HupF family hydrogenase formation chaperone [Thermoleophilaceae bacterium]
MRVLDVDGESRLALCADEAGATEEVAIDLVGPLSPGDAVLVHARVALVRLEFEALR